MVLQVSPAFLLVKWEYVVVKRFYRLLRVLQVGCGSALGGAIGFTTIEEYRVLQVLPMFLLGKLEMFGFSVGLYNEVTPEQLLAVIENTMKLCKKDKVRLSKLERLEKRTQIRLDDAAHGLDQNYYHEVKCALREYKKLFKSAAYRKASKQLPSGYMKCEICENLMKKDATECPYCGSQYE